MSARVGEARLDARNKTTKDNIQYSITNHDDEEQDWPLTSKTRYADFKEPDDPDVVATKTTVKSILHDDHKHHSFYKPTSNRTWVFATYLVLLSICIALLELTVATYPDVSTIAALTKRQANRQLSNTLWLRQVGITQTADGFTFVQLQPLEKTTSEPIPTPTPIPASSPDRDEFKPSVVSTPTLGPDKTNSNHPTTSVATPGEPFRGSQLSFTEGSQSVTVQPNRASQLTITPDDNRVVTPSPQRLVTTGDLTGTTVVGQPAAGSQLTALEPGITGGSISNALASTKSAQTPSIAPGPQASIISGSLIVSGTSTLATVELGHLSSDGSVILTNSQGQATATIAFASVSAQNTKGAATQDDAGQSSSSEQNSKGLLTGFQYFHAIYLPTIIAVALQSTWQLIFATFKMMEPFYQLAKPTGAAGKYTLTADYFATGLSSSFSKATLAGHWVIILAGQVQLLLALVVLFAPETMHIIPTAYCKTAISDRQPCSPRWVVNFPVVKGVEVLLVGCFSMIVSILVLNRKRRSGLYSDPSRIATMADLTVHKPLIQEIRDLSPSASKAEIELDLKDNRYMIGTFVAEGRQHYGIIKIPTATTTTFQKERFYKAALQRFDFWWESVTAECTTSLPYLPDFLCMTFIITLFGLILAYRLLPETNVDRSTFNLWMSSGKFGPGVLLNGFAIAIGFFIKNKERTLRLSHPYVLMSKGPRPAADCITAGTRTTPYTSFVKSLRSRDYSLALLSFAAILSDVILILNPGIPWSAAQTHHAYRVSTAVVLSILGFIFMVHVRVTFKEWRRGRHIGCPDTIATVLMRLCASHFVEEKNNALEKGIADMPEFGDDDAVKQHRRYEGSQGEKRYHFGCMEGVDGIHRYMVEEST